MTETTIAPMPLTALTEEELMFQSAVRGSRKPVGPVHK
jgi:hypothetical protein